MSPCEYWRVEQVNMAKATDSPTCRWEALLLPDSDWWIESMEEELRSLEKNKTWEIVFVARYLGCLSVMSNPCVSTLLALADKI